ncbi:MAG: 2-dehydropantoate 2-reductase [Candidatus Eremiobacteraeota bacterium]|nr:2-dehydropantoate 2-reductase [Candidatus Eremiobacteraeota bacterium]
MTAGARPRVAILGAGAMGSLFAYHLAQDNDVTLVDVREEVVAAITARGGVQLDEGPVRAVAATRDARQAYAANFLFVFVKAPSTLAAVRAFGGKLNPATPVVSLQNGLGNEEAIKAALGGAVALVIGVTDVASFAVGPGHSRPLGRGRTVIGSAGSSTATVRLVCELISASGLECSTAYDIRPHLWGKLLANAAINPIAALAGANNEVVASDPDAAQLARQIALEGAAVARALRISLPFPDPWEYVRGIVLATTESRNSMAVDLAAHAKTEIDAVNGAIVAAGARYGIPTPYNEALVRLIRAKERRVVQR